MNFSWLELPNSRFINPFPEYGCLLRSFELCYLFVPLLGLIADLYLPKSIASRYFEVIVDPLCAVFGVLFLKLLWLVPPPLEIGCLSFALNGSFSPKDLLLALFTIFPLV